MFQAVTSISIFIYITDNFQGQDMQKANSAE